METDRVQIDCLRRMGGFILSYHFHNLGVGLFRQVAPAYGHVVHQLVERGALVLLHLEV